MDKTRSHPLGEYAVINNFDEMGLKEPILRGIYSWGLERPSDIQSKAIPGENTYFFSCIKLF